MRNIPYIFVTLRVKEFFFDSIVNDLQLIFYHKSFEKIVLLKIMPYFCQGRWLLLKCNHLSSHGKEEYNDKSRVH